MHKHISRREGKGRKIHWQYGDDDTSISQVNECLLGWFGFWLALE
jgi:hypothetical protein